MKRLMVAGAGIAAAVFLSSCATSTAPPGSEAAYYGMSSSQASTALASVYWPIVFSRGTTTYKVFEPRTDSWDGHQLAARSAVAVQSAGQAQPAYGVISFSAITLVDKTAQTATLANLRITSLDFPSATNQASAWLATLRQELPKHAQPLSLDRLESSLVPTAQSPKPDSIDNTPPRVIISTRPALLVYIDGPPAWRPVPSTDLKRVVNTRVLLLKDSSNRYFLHVFDGYLQASSLRGPWAIPARAPFGADTAEGLALASG